MSREIKFRAWSYGIKKGSKWIFEPQMMYDEKMGDCLVWKSQGQNIEVMQYTGLKDKAGNLIYEGDIVSWIASTGGSMVTPIEWRDSLCRFICRTALGENRWIMMSGSNEYEIIGNIYEHPDLLPKGIVATE